MSMKHHSQMTIRVEKRDTFVAMMERKMTTTTRLESRREMYHATAIKLVWSVSDENVDDDEEAEWQRGDEGWCMMEGGSFFFFFPFEWEERKDINKTSTGDLPSEGRNLCSFPLWWDPVTWLFFTYSLFPSFQGGYVVVFWAIDDFLLSFFLTDTGSPTRPPPSSSLKSFSSSTSLRHQAQIDRRAKARVDVMSYTHSPLLSYSFCLMIAERQRGCGPHRREDGSDTGREREEDRIYTRKGVRELNCCESQKEERKERETVRREKEEVMPLESTHPWKGESSLNLSVFSWERDQMM